MYCICGLLSYSLGGIAWGQILAFKIILESSSLALTVIPPLSLPLNFYIWHFKFSKQAFNFIFLGFVSIFFIIFFIWNNLLNNFLFLISSFFDFFICQIWSLFFIAICFIWYIFLNWTYFTISSSFNVFFSG